MSRLSTSKHPKVNLFRHCLFELVERKITFATFYPFLWSIFFDPPTSLVNRRTNIMFLYFYDSLSCALKVSIWQRFCWIIVIWYLLSSSVYSKNLETRMRKSQDYLPFLPFSSPPLLPPTRARRRICLQPHTNLLSLQRLTIIIRKYLDKLCPHPNAPFSDIGTPFSLNNKSTWASRWSQLFIFSR